MSFNLPSNVGLTLNREPVVICIRSFCTVWSGLGRRKGVDLIIICLNLYSSPLLTAAFSVFHLVRAGYKKPFKKLPAGVQGQAWGWAGSLKHSWRTRVGRCPLGLWRVPCQPSLLLLERNMAGRKGMQMVLELSLDVWGRAWEIWWTSSGRPTFFYILFCPSPSDAQGLGTVREQTQDPLLSSFRQLPSLFLVLIPNGFLLLL